MRKLIDGTQVSDLNDPVTLIVKTKCPHKYLLIDLETNQIYRGTDINHASLHWVKTNNSFVNQFIKLNSKTADATFNVQEILDAVDDLLKL